MPIRKATEQEMETIIHHSFDALKESSMGFIPHKQENAWKVTEALLTNGGLYLVYIDDNVLQGWVGVGYTMDAYINEDIGIISEIFVLPPYRNQGKAEELLEAAFQNMVDNGCKKVQLQVFEGNTVIDLYKKLGFYMVASLMERRLMDDK